MEVEGGIQTILPLGKFDLDSDSMLKRSNYYLWQYINI